MRSFNGLTLPLSKMLWTLDHIFYTGVFRFSGEVYEGKHPPLISRELFERVQAVRKKAGRGRYAKHSRFPLRATAHCWHCGCQFTAELKKGHEYYRCGKRRGPCDSKTIREEAFAQAIRTGMCMASLRDDFAEKMLAEAEREKVADRAKQAALVGQQKARLAELGTLLDRLLDVFLAGDIEREEFTARKERYIQEKVALADEVEKFETKNASRLEPVIDFLRASRQAKYDAQTENSEDLRNFCKKVGWNLVFAGWNLAEASGAPQAAPPPDGCGSQGGSEGLPPPDPRASRRLCRTLGLPESPQKRPLFDRRRSRCPVCPDPAARCRRVHPRRKNLSFARHENRPDPPHSVHAPVGNRRPKSAQK